MGDKMVFDGPGKWYTGNLHCHSTGSDGVLSPRETAEIYKKQGWNFLALTEHDKYTYCKELEDENFLIIPGAEIGVSNKEMSKYFHVVGVEQPSNGYTQRMERTGQQVNIPAWEGIQSVQNVIDEQKKNGVCSILCHPDWSRLDGEDLKTLKDYFAVEIFNYGCELESHSGSGTYYWDAVLRQGRRVWGVATDDAHHRLKDECGGWVQVKAEEFSHGAILDALQRGRFYSSSGPEIYEFGVRGNEVVIECSEAAAIHFIAYGELCWGQSTWSEKGVPLSSSSYGLNGREKYVRVECVDKFGRTAWTNPIFFD